MYDPKPSCSFSLARVYLWRRHCNSHYIFPLEPMEPLEQIAPRELRTVDRETGKEILIAQFHFQPVPENLLADVSTAYFDAMHAQKHGDKALTPEVKQAVAKALLGESARVTQHFAKAILAAEEAEDIEHVKALTAQRAEWIKNLQEQANALT